MTKSVVRWHDGTYDSKRVCMECGQVDCQYPVYPDYYKEIVVRKSYYKLYEENRDE
jgi:hypothetical protein